MIVKTTQRVLALLLLACFMALPAQAEPEVVATSLGQDGVLFSLVRGTYGELFPGGNEAKAEMSILALRRTSPNGTSQIDAVPQSLDQEAVESAELVVEPVSGVAYVFWQSWANLIQSRFRVTSFDGADWSDAIDVSGPSFAWRTSPAFAITRDRFTDITAEGGPEAGPTSAQVQRTVLHIVWSEEGEGDRWVTKYAPLVLVDGEYIGQHPILALDDLVAVEEGAVGSDLRVAPVVRARQGENSVVAAFLDQRSGKIVTVDLRFAVGELSRLGDEVVEEISLHGDTDIEALTNAVSARLIAHGDVLRPEILISLTASIEDHLRRQAEDGGSNVAALGEESRAQLIDIGLRLTDRDMRRVTHNESRAQLIDIGARGDRPGRGNYRHDVRAAVAGVQPLPDLAGTAVPDFLVSTNSFKVVLVWQEENRVRYQESAMNGAWKASQHLTLSSQLSRSQAMAVLKERAEQH